MNWWQQWWYRLIRPRTPHAQAVRAVNRSHAMLIADSGAWHPVAPLPAPTQPTLLPQLLPLTNIGPAHRAPTPLPDQPVRAPGDNLGWDAHKAPTPQPDQPAFLGNNLGWDAHRGPLAPGENG